jgi:hypothetical protein
MSREGAVPADLSFIELNLADHPGRRKGRKGLFPINLA